MSLEVIEKTVDLTYGLGGLINIYDHVGDPSAHIRARWPHPTLKHFQHYIEYSLAKERIWKADPLTLLPWWQRRDHQTLQATLASDAQPSKELLIDLAGPTESAPTDKQPTLAIDVLLPLGLAVQSVERLPDTNGAALQTVETQPIPGGVKLHAIGVGKFRFTLMTVQSSNKTDGK